MQVLIEYIARPDSQQAMQQHRAAHTQYRMRQPKLRVAMQVQSTERAAAGSIILLETESLEEAKAIAEGDPFVAEGVFTIASIRPVEVRFCNLTAGPP